MNIDIYSTYYLPRLGGVENAILQLSNALVKLDHDVSIHTTRDLGYRRKNNLPSREALHGHVVYRYPCIPLKLERLLMKKQSVPISLSLATSMAKINPDVINIHVPHQGVAEINAFFARMNPAPMILTIHNFEVYGSRLEKLAYRLLGIATKMMVNRASSIIVSSTLFKNRYFRGKLRSKIHPIHYGVDTKRFNMDKRPRGLHVDEKKILFVSVLDDAHKYKGLEWLLKAIPHVDTTGINLKLKIIGSGALKEHYEKMVARSSMANDIAFLGRVSDLELEKLYHESDLLVLPSISELEGFGLVALEAMASGTPVVVSDICGVSEVVKHLNFGITVSPFGRDSGKRLQHWFDRLSDRPVEEDYDKQIAKAIEKAIHHDWANQRVACADIIKQEYTWEKYAEKHVEIFSSMK
ncbi:glycosyltransferase [Candidatus Bathyarchaeota archaeon]|nr:glycosyltransferase [Candidatus Bathyarchaeota archaeon]